MADLHVSEFTGLAAAPNNTDIVAASADGHVADQVVAIGAASAALPNPFNPKTRWLRVVPGEACSIAIGEAPVAAVGGWFLGVAGQEYWIRVPEGQGYNIAAIADTL